MDSNLSLPPTLPITWSVSYHPEWDNAPAAYLQAQIVRPQRSRRLGRYSDPLHERKGYIGVYHLAHRQNPEGLTRFFLSLFVHGQTLGLQSYATMLDLLSVLTIFHVQGTPWGEH